MCYFFLIILLNARNLADLHLKTDLWYRGILCQESNFSIECPSNLFISPSYSDYSWMWPAKKIRDIENV